MSLEHRNPWRRLRSLPGVRVVVTHLECGRWGFYDVDDDTIYIDARLTQAERRCTIAHELVHVERGDEPCLTGWHEAKQERHVDQLAARDLIPLAPLADALGWAENEWEVADVLWVDVATVRTRIGGLTPVEVDYIERRLAAKEEAA